jgi:pimeloyl-ACP methyl ester carboxylesterase
VNKRFSAAAFIFILVAAIILIGRTMIMADFDFSHPLKVKGEKNGNINVEDGKLFYEISGEGKTIVMLHDGILHRETWNYQFREFGKDYRVIRYDRRGYGKSKKPEKPFSDLEDLKKLFADLKIDKAILIGCSAGGGLAIDFTLDSPEKVEALILVGAVVSGFEYTEHMYTRGGHLDKELWDDSAGFLNYWYHEDPYSIYEKNTYARTMADALLQKNPHNLSMERRSLQKRPERLAINHLSEITVPTLYIVGEYDIQDVHALSGVVDAGMPNSRRVIVNDAAHLVHMEHPDLFNQMVRSFFLENEFLAVADKDGYDKAAEMLKEKDALTPETFPFSERQLINMAYGKLRSGDIDNALILLKLGVTVFPNSWNAYDSYAEGLLAAGDTAGAIQNYKKSLELNPNNESAMEKLKDLGE